MRAGLSVRWSPAYWAEWDETPEAYVEQGHVAWGRSRRLARFDDAALGFKAYVGVQHDDPARWNVPGEARARFFLSLFVENRTVMLRTFGTMCEALTALALFHERLSV